MISTAFQIILLRPLLRLHGLSLLALLLLIENYSLASGFDVIDWIVKTDEPQKLDDVAVLLSILKLSEKQNHNQLCQLSLAINASDFKSGFCEGANRLCATNIH